MLHYDSCPAHLNKVEFSQMACILRLDVSVRDDGGDLLEGVKVHVPYLSRGTGSTYMGGDQCIEA